MKKLLFSFVTLLASILTVPLFAQVITPEDGDWSAQYVQLYNTDQADLMVRVGDIDNLGFGWPSGFNPFSGNSTPSHAYPWSTNPDDHPGTDRIMVITSYAGSPPAGRDGYTSTTSRPGNSVIPISLTYDLQGIAINSVLMQIFVDDFQASLWHAHYTVTINNIRIPVLEDVINALLQTGPIGKMISVYIPNEYLHLFAGESISIVFDDLTTGAGDGYAIDFVKLLFNPKDLGQYATVSGFVTDANTFDPIEGVQLTANGQTSVFSQADGSYTIDNIPAGIISIKSYIPGYGSETKIIDVAAGASGTLNFSLKSPAPVMVEFTPDTLNVINDMSIPFSITFDQEMDQGTFNENNIILSDLNGDLSGEITKNEFGFSFQPDSLLQKDMTYLFTIKSGVKNLLGVNAEKDIVLIFNTQSTYGLPEVSLIAPDIYPNPVKKDGIVSFRNNEAAEYQFSLISLHGAEVYKSGTLSAERYNFDLQRLSLKPGVYFIRFVSKGTIAVSKLIITN